LRAVFARLLARVGLITPEQRAWAWYDCGNSAYFTTVITAIFPAFFASYAAVGLPPNAATTRFGLITTIGMAIVAVLAPILGAYGDHTASRKRLLVACAAVGIASTFALTTITEGGWQWAALLFVVGNIGVSGSLVFYDSMLPSVASPDETDRVSSAGYALGYLGGGLLLVLNLAWVLQPQMFGLPGTVAAIKLSFASVGVWWLLFMIPLLRRVPEPPRIATAADTASGSPLRGALARLAHTFVEIRAYPQAFLALLAMLVYQDGIQTIIRFAGIYGAEVGVGQSAQIAAFAMVQLLGVPFAFIFGALGGRLGTKRAIFLALAVYSVAATLGYFMQNATHFFLLAGLVATVQGGAQALSRSLFARLIPPAKTSEYFGFYAVVERFATILGPLVFTLSGALTGSSRSAVLAMIAFFVAGGWLLSRVDVAAGERAARAGDAAAITPA
jgi:MFS transporter, UMF1 family